jgi:RimJ/RimL family protein N-acetyltransferase
MDDPILAIPSTSGGPQQRRPMTPNLQPTLAGDRVVLRPLRPEDWDELSAVAADPLIWEQHPARDRWKREVFADYFRNALDEVHHQGGAFAVIDRATGAIIGCTRFHGYDPDASELEIGWTFLARSHWGGRCNPEMKRLMLDHAFQFVQRVIFLVGVDNIRSQTAVSRLGAAPDGFVERTNFGGPVSRSIKFILTRPRR